MTQNLRNLPVVAPLRTKYMYNNMMYTVMAYLVEAKSGLSFSDFLENTFFQPLGMTSTSFQPSRARAKGFGDRIATGYNWVEKKQKQMPVPMVECPEADGAGSIITSVNDYIKWVRALIHKQGPVSEGVYNGITRPRTITNPILEDPNPFMSPGLYGAGLESWYYRGHMEVEHGGGVTGFGTKQWFVPGHKFGCVITTNADGGHAAGWILVRELIDEVLKVPEAERVDWEAIADKNEDKDKQEGDPDYEEAEIRKAILKELSGENQDDKKEAEKTTKEKKEAELQPQPLTTPFEAYAGTYSHPGYHEFVLEVKDGELFVDASDRSFGFTGVFHHVADQTQFVLRIAESEGWGGQDLGAIRAQFKLEDGRATQFGAALDPDSEDSEHELIWFTRK